MGVVYEAEQEQPRRTVALKVIKSGLADPKLVRRFEQESLALGRLQHPGIAQIYEAGTAETGFGPQPYFAMEFIRGESLLQYALAHQIGIRQKLELMAKICEAVHHAHQRGVIHRDLKPGNILVDETGQPKILDFGVARATDSDAHVSRQTDLGQLVGTLAYMSPEQVLADPLEVDTRSDVYALGVILYELLAGRLPYRISPKLHEAVQTIREEEPTALSAVSSAYRGDIETIVDKALEKDKTRRYASAAELAADIRRYLQDEPIMARPASAAYQLQKFSRRHKALVVGAAAVFIVLIVGIIVSTREAARANAQSATARAISDFLQNDLLAQASAANQSGPNTKPDPDLKVRTALDRAAARIPGRLDRQPEVEACHSGHHRADVHGPRAIP
jgi:eukaryotic-like serine/threonine-protein kinase